MKQRSRSWLKWVAAGAVALSSCTAVYSSGAPSASPFPTGIAAPPIVPASPSRSPSKHVPTKKSPSPTHQVVAGVPAADMPNRGLTPGAAVNVGVAQICVPGYSASVRNVSDALKAEVYNRYGIAWVPYEHEVDHLISLEIGGSNAITNLWPEPYAGAWGARTKDVLENRLHELVCAGSLSLRSAQTQEATNWVAAYHRYVGGNPATSGGSGTGSTSSGGYYASSYPTARTIYCADDPDWKNLSPNYLVHFQTWAQAHTRFPSYHLHRPC